METGVQQLKHQKWQWTFSLCPRVDASLGTCNPTTNNKPQTNKPPTTENQPPILNAKGSLAELETLMIISRELNYAKAESSTAIEEECKSLTRQITSLINRLKSK